MWPYLARRLVFFVGVLWGSVTLVFVLSHVVPGDPARAALGPDATNVMVANYRHEMGLDRPLLDQYGIYIAHLVHGDFGTSILTRRPVATELETFLPATVELMIPSFILGAGGGLLFGILSAIRRGRTVDHLFRAVSVAGMSMPVFWLGLVLQVIFYRDLAWLPFGGRLAQNVPAPPDWTGLYVIDGIITGDWPAVGSALAHLILPAITLSMILLGVTSRMVRASLLETLREDYVRTALAKGLSGRMVLWRHALRNAWVPVVTVIGLRVGAMFGGAVLTETIFAWPGIGRYAFNALQNLDYPVVIGYTFWVTFAYAAVNLGVDALYAALDPRIRYV